VPAVSLDSSFKIAAALCSDVQSRLEQIETEQDACVQLINRFLTEVLGWGFADIMTEKYSEAGYADFLVSSAGRKRLVVEAKRIGPILVNTANREMATYKVGGPALAAAMPGIRQAATYCLDHGAGYAALTTGVTAFVFPTLDSVLKNFAVFYDLLSHEGVTQRTYDVHFAKASGLTAEAFEPMIAANRNEYIRLLQPTQLASDLEPVFREFFGSLSGDNDPEMLTECFVENVPSESVDRPRVRRRRIIVPVSDRIKFRWKIPPRVGPL
jgi:hypothetical protein